MGDSYRIELSFDSISEGWEADPLCKKCGENVSGCTCSGAAEPMPPEEHRLEYSVQMRRGKPVTVAGEFNIDKYEARELLSYVKKSLGCGGSFKSGRLEIQGRRVEELKRLLYKRGFKR